MVYEYLQEIGAIGAENAVCKAALAKPLGMSEDGVKDTVSDERRQQGYLICSNSRGYYMAKDRAELAEFAARETATANTHRETAEIFYRALREQEGQLSVFLDPADDMRKDDE